MKNQKANTMKSIFIIRISFLFLLISGLVISCSDDFLDVKVQGGVSTQSDPKLAEKLVTGVYNSLLQGDSWGNGEELEVLRSVGSLFCRQLGGAYSNW